MLSIPQEDRAPLSDTFAGRSFSEWEVDDDEREDKKVIKGSQILLSPGERCGILDLSVYILQNAHIITC